MSNSSFACGPVASHADSRGCSSAAEDLQKLTKEQLIERLRALESTQRNFVSNESSQPLLEADSAAPDRSRPVEEVLQRERSFTAAILETIGALIIVVDRQGRFVRFNRACEKLTGYSAREMLGRRLWDNLLIPEEVDDVEAVFQELCAGKFPNSHENYWVGKDGRRHLITWSNTVLTGPDGSVEYLIGTGIDVTERRRIENAEREWLTRFELTFENAAIGIAHSAPDGQWLRVNQKLCEIVGYTRSELLTKTFGDITHPDDLERDLETVRELLRGTVKSATYEKRYIRKNGAPVWIDLTVSLVRDAMGNPEYFIACIADISRRKQAEAALAETESRLEAIVNQATTIIFLKDREGRRLMVNDEYLRAFGFPSREQVIGKNDFDLRPPEIAQQLRDNDIRVWETGVSHTVEEKVNQPGGFHTYLTKKFLLVDKEGKPCALCGIGTDITARKEAEEAIRSSQERLRNVLDTLYIFVGVLTPDGTMTKANRAPLDAAGISLEDVRGKKFWECFWWSHSPAVQNQLREAIERAARGESSRFDVEVCVANGKRIIVDFMLAPMRDNEGQIINLIASAVDITDRKQLERELLEISAREQMRIGQDLHDDLCQRLTATELLAHTLTLDLQTRDAPEAAKAKRVSTYIREAIAHTRLLARGLVPVNVAADGFVTALSELALNSEEMFRIECRFECLTPVRVSNPEAATHLYRIAQESISNAVRHGKATHLSITLQPHENRVCLLIADNGSGIRQPRPTCKGMGLRIMQHRAGMIGATLDVRPGTNGGTEVACIFPHEP